MNPRGSASLASTQRVLTIVFLSLLLGSAFFALYFARWVIVTVLIGVGLGILLIPCIGFLQRNLHLPRSLSAAIMALLLLGLVAATGYLIGNLLTAQVVPVLHGITKVANEAGEAVRKTQGSKPTNLVQRILSNLDLADAANRAVGIVTTGVKISVTMVLGILAVIVIAVYLAAESERYEWILVSFFPECHRAEVRRTARLAGYALRVWFCSQLINLAIIGTVSGLGLLIVGIPSWTTLGIISGITEIIPYVGPILSGIVALIVTLASDPNKFWWVLVLFTAIHQFENHVVVPLIMRGAASLPPVSLLIAMLVMGEWFGILGVFLAAPLVSIVRTLYLEIYVPRMDRWKQPVLPPIFPPEGSDTMLTIEKAV